MQMVDDMGFSMEENEEKDRKVTELEKIELGMYHIFCVLLFSLSLCPESGESRNAMTIPHVGRNFRNFRYFGFLAHKLIIRSEEMRIEIFGKKRITCGDKK